MGKSLPSTVRVQGARARSQKALNVFEKVIKQLQEANQELATAREEDIATIESLQANLSASAEQEKKNTEIISKINSIID